MRLADLFRKGRIQELARQNEILEERLNAAKNELERKNQELQIAKKTISDLGLMPGKRTLMISDFAVIRHYLFDRSGDPALAEPWLDKLFGRLETEALEFFSYRKSDGKSVYLLEESEDDSLSLHGKFQVLIKNKDAHYSRLAEKVIAACNSPGKPNVCEMRTAGKYLILEKVHGIDLYSFYSSCKDDALVELLLRKQLRDSAFLSKLGREMDVKTVTDHRQKALEVFAYVGQHHEAEKHLGEIFSSLDSEATLPFRDAASWNYMLTSDAAIALTSAKDRAEKEQLVEAGVYAIDFDNLGRRTFQADDAIHALEWPVPILARDRINDLREYYRSCLAELGEDTTRFHACSETKRLYRHMRMWHFYCRNAERYPDADWARRRHHARRFNSCLAELAASRPAGYTCLQQLGISMMEACSRA